MDAMRRVLAIGLAVAIPACNTVEGFGRDLQRGGAALSDTAEDVKRGN